MTPRAPIQLSDPSAASGRNRQYGISATPAAYGNAARTNGSMRLMKMTGAPQLSNQRWGRETHPAPAAVELEPLPLRQLASAVVADGVGDRGPGDVADSAGDDDA